MNRDLARGAYMKALQRHIPDLQPEDCPPGPAGVRARATAAEEPFDLRRVAIQV